jgi:hypothetical protein
MRSKELDNLVRTGLLKAEPGDQKEFEGLVDSGRKRLADAKVSGLSPEGQFSLAYDSAHAFALAALRWHGYRPDRRRFVVFQALQHTLGVNPETWRVLDKCHTARNLAEYEGHFQVDMQLLRELLATADSIRAAVEQLGPISSSR